MPHRLGALERLRQLVAGLLHLPLSSIGLYAERSIPPRQYAFTVGEPYPELEGVLHRLGFTRNLLASLKRREYAGPPEVSVASWARYPGGALRSDYQLHLSLYVGPDETTTDVYAHWEPSWIRHPIRHYRAAEVDATEGVRRVRRHFDDAGVDYEVKPIEERFAAVGSDPA
jgi:hypothetical protein